MYAQLCSSRSTIFTSVVVYSRTTQNTNPIIKSSVMSMRSDYWNVLRALKVDRQKKKKNGAHTHVGTTVQLDEQIFTSVVVYSRTK